MIQLGQQPTYPVRDNEAYEERLSIVLESWPQSAGFDMQPYTISNECANRTRYSKVATAAINDDDVPLVEWLVELAERHGAGVAVEVWQDLHTQVMNERRYRDRSGLMKKA